MIKNNNILWSGIASTCLLILFFTLKLRESPILDLDFKWIAVAGVPLLIGLLYSGIIKNFKGFGIELETHFSNTVKEVEIIGKLETLDSPDISKESLEKLYPLSEGEKNQIQRLKFEMGKKNYYNDTVISEYFKMLPNLKFVEIINTKGQFICLIPHYSFKNNQEELDKGQLEKFISAIENGTVIEDFQQSIVSHLTESDSISFAYKKIINSKKGNILDDQFLPVIDSSSKMKGLVSKRNLEEKISRQVVELIDKNN